MLAKFKKRASINYSSGNFLALVGVISIIALIGFLFFLNMSILKNRARLNNQLAAIQKEMEELKNKNENLKIELPKMQDTDYIEKTAREELNLQKPGEKVIGFILPDNKNEQQGRSPEHWWNKIWEWIKSKI